MTSSPSLQARQRTEDMWVLNSVLSLHRAHLHWKYQNFPKYCRLLLFPSVDETYLVLISSPALIPTWALTCKKVNQNNQHP